MDGSFDQQATSELEAAETRWGLTTCLKAGYSRSELWAWALTTEAAADSQGCAYRLNVWTKRRKAPIGNQQTS